MGTRQKEKVEIQYKDDKGESSEDTNYFICETEDLKERLINNDTMGKCFVTCAICKKSYCVLTD